MLMGAQIAGSCVFIPHLPFLQQTQDGTFGTPAFLEFEETGETAWPCQRGSAQGSTRHPYPLRFFPFIL